MRVVGMFRFCVVVRVFCFLSIQLKHRVLKLRLDFQICTYIFVIGHVFPVEKMICNGKRKHG